MSQFFYFVFCLLCRLDIGIHRITDQSLRISLYILSVPSHITVYLTSPSAYHCISYQSLRTSLYLISPSAYHCISYQSLRTSLYLISPFAHHYILSVPPHITVYLISPSAYHCISYQSLRSFSAVDVHLESDAKMGKDTGTGVDYEAVNNEFATSTGIGIGLGMDTYVPYLQRLMGLVRFSAAIGILDAN